MTSIDSAIRRLEQRIAAAEQERDAALSAAHRLRLLGTVDQALLEAIASHEGTDRFEADLARLLGVPVRVLEPGGETPRPSSVGEDIPGLASLLAGANDGDLITCRTAGGSDVVVAPAIVGGRVLGAIACPAPADQLLGAALQRASRALSALLSFQQALSDAAARENHELLTTLITGRPLAELPVLAHRVRALGVRLSEPFALAVISPIAADPSKALRLIASRSQDRLIGAVHDGHACVIVNADSPEQLARAWARLLAGRGMNATVAVEPVTRRAPESRAAEVRELAAIPQAHESTLRILRAAHQLRRAGEAVTRATLGVASLVLGDDDANTASSIVRVMIGELIAYDEAHRTDLATTARVYLDGNQRVTATAAALHVHENTVRQRLARIDEILGQRWRRGPTALDTHLALRLHELTVSDRHTI